MVAEHTGFRAQHGTGFVLSRISAFVSNTYTAQSIQISLLATFGPGIARESTFEGIVPVWPPAPFAVPVHEVPLSSVVDLQRILPVFVAMT